VEEKQMKNKAMVCVSAVLGLALVFAITLHAGRSQAFYLDWHQVVPSGSGDPNVFGDGTIEVNSGQSRLCYTLRVFVYPSSSTDWPPIGATINHAPAGSNGPVVVDLAPDFGDASTSGCVAVDSSTARDIQRNSDQYYVLVTDNSHPEGAARAQLTR
jgi:hypothetical protein